MTKMAGMNKRLAGVLHEERCILSLPGPLRGPSLPSETVDTFFSDGAASQYKNRKNFLNLCHHKDDFKSKLNGIFQLLHMERGHVIDWAEQSSN